MGTTANQGDDIAGTISAVGHNVTEFKVGDRVSAFHEMRTPGGSWAEYALAWAHTTFHIPQKTTFEEAAAIPLAAMTAAVGLYVRLGLPEPWKVGEKDIPLVIYGGASAVGAYTIQFAQRSQLHPLIVVAGAGAPYVETLIDRSKGDTIIDYRKGDEAVVQGIKDALKGKTLEYAYDAVSEKGSYQVSLQLTIPVLACHNFIRTSVKSWHPTATSRSSSQAESIPKSRLPSKRRKLWLALSMQTIKILATSSSATLARDCRMVGSSRNHRRCRRVAWKASKAHYRS